MGRTAILKGKKVEHLKNFVVVVAIQLETSTKVHLWKFDKKYPQILRSSFHLESGQIRIHYIKLLDVRIWDTKPSKNCY